MVKKILFLGTYLSLKNGSQDVSTYLSRMFSSEGITTRLVSSNQNQFLRLIEIIWALFKFKQGLVILDLYSGKSIFVNFFCIGICRIRGLRSIVILHGGALLDAYENRSFFLKYIFVKSSVLVSPSNYLTNSFRLKGYDLKYIPNSIDLALFPYRPKPKIEYRILGVRAFSKAYNPQIAIKVLKEVLEDFSMATLTMVGPDLGELDSTKELAKKLGIYDKISFLGPIKNEDLPKIYQRSDVYINTTSYESFGMTLFEAGASGTPIVSNSVGEIPLIWTNGRNMILIEENDVKSYAKGIKLIFNDFSFRQDMANEARFLVQQYTWECIGESWMEILEKVK